MTPSGRTSQAKRCPLMPKPDIGVGRPGAKRGDAFGTEIKVKGLFIRAKKIHALRGGKALIRDFLSIAIRPEKG